MDEVEKCKEGGWVEGRVRQGGDSGGRDGVRGTMEGWKGRVGRVSREGRE